MRAACAAAVAAWPPRATATAAAVVAVGGGRGGAAEAPPAPLYGGRPMYCSRPAAAEFGLCGRPAAAGAVRPPRGGRRPRVLSGWGGLSAAGGHGRRSRLGEAASDGGREGGAQRRAAGCSLGLCRRYLRREAEKRAAGRGCVAAAWHSTGNARWRDGPTDVLVLVVSVGAPTVLLWICGGTAVGVKLPAHVPTPGCPVRGTEKERRWRRRQTGQVVGPTARDREAVARHILCSTAWGPDLFEFLSSRRGSIFSSLFFATPMVGAAGRRLQAQQPARVPALQRRGVLSGILDEALHGYFRAHPPPPLT